MFETFHAFGHLLFLQDSNPSQMSIGRAGFTVLARGDTPLHDAARNGQTKAVKVLLEAKASVAATNDKGWGLLAGLGLVLRGMSSWASGRSEVQK